MNKKETMINDSGIKFFHALSLNTFPTLLMSLERGCGDICHLNRGFSLFFASFLNKFLSMGLN